MKLVDKSLKSNEVHHTSSEQLHVQVSHLSSSTPCEAQSSFYSIIVVLNW